VFCQGRVTRLTRAMVDAKCIIRLVDKHFNDPAISKILDNRRAQSVSYNTKNGVMRKTKSIHLNL
jgi:hypothetical protein